MNKMAKRLIAVVLTVCLALSVMVPAAWAVTKEADGTLKYTFGSAGCSVNGTPITAGTSGYEITSSGTASTNYVGLKQDTKADFTDWSYLYISTSATIQVQSKVTIVTFSSSNSGSFVAMQIEVPKAGGTYELTFGTTQNSNGGLADVYIVDAATFAEAKPDGYLTTAEQTKAVIDGLMQSGKVINASDIMVLNSVTSDSTSNVGVVTFPAVEEEGDYAKYVLLFRGRSDLPEGAATNHHTTRRRIQLQTLTMTPVVATVDGKGYETLESAIAAAAAASSSAELLDDVSVEKALEIPANATLNLAGKKLEAPSVKSFGNIIDSSEKDTGVLVSANVEFASGNKELPLKSGENSYRFFSFKLNSLGRQSNVADKRFWFELTFDAKEEAYNLINSADNAGLEIQFDLYWNSNKLDLGGDVKLASDKVQSWAQNMAGSQRYGIYVNVTGFPETGTFGIAPKIVSAGVTYTASTMTYEHTAEG